LEGQATSAEPNDTYVNKTFRLKVSTIGRLESDAQRVGISVNSLIQNSIQRFVEWDRYSDSVQMTSFFPNMLDGILEYVDVDTVQKMADHIVTTSCFKDVSLFIFKRYDPEAFLKMVSLMDRFGNNYRMQAGNGMDGYVSLSLYHNYGKKWSIFMGTILHKELLRLKVEHGYEMSDNAIVLRFGMKEATLMGLRPSDG
jgi:hypothetical protein